MTLGSQGEAILGEGFDDLRHAWLVGTVAMARAGTRIVIDDVLLGGGVSQGRLRQRLAGLGVRVEARCALSIAVGRGITRGDRVIGMRRRRPWPSKGVRYDVEVATGHTESLECAQAIAVHVI